MSENQENEGRLSRWSQRKLAASKLDSQRPVVEEEQLAVGEVDERDVELEANRQAAEAANLDDLTAESDISVFLKEGVPELLKKQALAKLWRTSPVFANVDGLVDYDDDFGSPDLIMKTFQSAYRVGKGYFDNLADAEADPQSHEEQMVEEETTEISEEGDEPTDSKDEPSVDSEDLSDADDSPADYEELAEEAEELPMPKVSLRRRLELDESV